MPNKNKPDSSKNSKSKKSAGNNQWTNPSAQKPSSSDRRDGPGGENGQ